MNSIELRRQYDLKELFRMGCKPEVALEIAGGITYSVLDGKIASRYLYVAGPMRGYDKFNFPAFDAARDRLVSLDWNVISPADIDRVAGISETTLPEVVCDPRAFVYRDSMAIQFLNAKRGDAIALLPAWERSTGAPGELFLARWMGLRFINACSGADVEKVDFGQLKLCVEGDLQASKAKHATASLAA